MKVGYYVHHHGRGHATRAGVIGAELKRHGHSVTFFGSGPLPDGDQIVLPRDDVLPADSTQFDDATRNGALHWAPLAPGGSTNGYRERSWQIAQWINANRPDVFVVDVSAEVTALVRLLAVPVVVVAQPGSRVDNAHQMGYRLATAILAPWPDGARLLDVGSVDTPVIAVGGITRFDAQSGAKAVQEKHRTSGVKGAFLVGGEGWDAPDFEAQIRAVTPEITWSTPLDVPVAELLADADVVITHAGQNAIADVAHYGCAAVVVPQERPFDEQARMAKTLGQLGLAETVESGASAADVAQAVRRALDARARNQSAANTPRAGWGEWKTTGAAARAVDVIENAAAGSGDLVSGEWERDDSDSAAVSASSAQVTEVGQPESETADFVRDQGDLADAAPPDEPQIAVITPVRGRLAHLRNQRRFLEADRPNVKHVVVAVDSPDLEQELRDAGVLGPGLDIVHCPADPLGMPTALARNMGAEHALALGCDLLIFLDVDCAPLPGFIDGFIEAWRQAPTAIYNALVTYLPEQHSLDGLTSREATKLTSPHPARPAPGPGEVLLNAEYRFLWSLAFAITADGWRKTGGFCTEYVGYGGEDTDFGMSAQRAGLPMAWVGSSHALHQYHPTKNPPLHHLADIVRNSTLFYERQGFWPMSGWLEEFAKQGLIKWSSHELSLTTQGRAFIEETAASK